MELNSSLPFHVKMPVFNVPEGYFDRFADEVLAKIKGKQAVSPSDELAALSPILAGISRKMPFSVPENYFSETTTSLPGLLQDEERLPEVLLAAGKVMPYDVPAGYFDGLPQRVLNQVAKPKAKVISFNRNWMRYAAAAVLIGVVAISSIVYFFSGSKADPATQSESWIAKKLKNVSNKELEEFIMTASFLNGTETAKNGKQGSQDVEKMLKDVSDTELDAFLSQVPSGNGDNLFMN
jgi:hypothetical protein